MPRITPPPSPTAQARSLSGQQKTMLRYMVLGTQTATLDKDNIILVPMTSRSPGSPLPDQPRTGDLVWFDPQLQLWRLTRLGFEVAASLTVIPPGSPQSWIAWGEWATPVTEVTT